MAAGPPGTITATGPFQGLATNLVPMRDITQSDSEMSALNISPQDLLNLPDEIRQMIEVFQTNWGAQVPGAITGTRLNFWATVVLLRTFLNAYVQYGVTRLGP